MSNLGSKPTWGYLLASWGLNNRQAEWRKLHLWGHQSYQQSEQWGHMSGGEATVSWVHVQAQDLLQPQHPHHLKVIPPPESSWTQPRWGWNVLSTGSQLRMRRQRKVKRLRRRRSTLCRESYSCLQSAFLHCRRGMSCAFEEVAFSWME